MPPANPVDPRRPTVLGNGVPARSDALSRRFPCNSVCVPVESPSTPWQWPPQGGFELVPANATARRKPPEGRFCANSPASPHALLTLSEIEVPHQKHYW